ncbi:MAG: histidine phosphatase family protein, partial [Cryobacterium sp.]|nr:histidine phosphatase family protein [Cryobacterium sp.]
PGPGLTGLGSRQASAIPDALRLESIDAIFASTLVRTQLTAQPLAAALRLDVQVADGLHEIEAGALEGLSDPASLRSYFETVLTWGTGNLTARMPGGPDGNSFFARFDADIATAAGADTAAVFSHGAAIRVWTAARANNVSPMFAGTTDLENTGVVELSGSPEAGWTLVSWVGLSVGSPGGPQLLVL